MINRIEKLLPFHPLPESDESIGQWIDRLANSNKVKFKLMLEYIGSLSKHNGFIQTLNQLTGLSIKEISQMKNEFKSKYWEEYKQCPIKNCKFQTKYRKIIFPHIAFKHNIGV